MQSVDPAPTSSERSTEPAEESRRLQLIEVTIDSLAELGYVGTTLAQVTGRAGVTPGLVAHYFGDKDGLMDAAFRSLARRVTVGWVPGRHDVFTAGRLHHLAAALCEGLDCPQPLAGVAAPFMAADGASMAAPGA